LSRWSILKNNIIKKFSDLKKKLPSLKRKQKTEIIENINETEKEIESIILNELRNIKEDIKVLEKQQIIDRKNFADRIEQTVIPIKEPEILTEQRAFKIYLKDYVVSGKFEVYYSNQLLHMDIAQMDSNSIQTARAYYMSKNEEWNKLYEHWNHINLTINGNLFLIDRRTKENLDYSEWSY